MTTRTSPQHNPQTSPINKPHTQTPTQQTHKWWETCWKRHRRRTVEATSGRKAWKLSVAKQRWTLMVPRWSTAATASRPSLSTLFSTRGQGTNQPDL